MILFAPLQGYTDAAYRRIHHAVCGGIDEYYSPFVRWEKEGVRRKDLRDIDPKNNEGTPTVPQVIAKSRDEFARLCDTVQSVGWRRIDLNMGCPFPMQTHAGRGSGLLPHPDIVADIIAEMQTRPDVTFSVKMRLGQDSTGESMTLLPILNEAPLTHITLHPRLGCQQYKGRPDLDAFDLFYHACQKPLIYNGDITTREQITDIRQRYPQLKGFMLGRGLLARPWLFSDKEPHSAIQEMHHLIYQYACQTLQGETQILARLHAFWEYSDTLLPKKTYKQIMKSNTLHSYMAAIRLSNEQ